MVKTLVLGPLCANCHIVTDENGVGFVVDPGANAWKIFPELDEDSLTVLQAAVHTHCFPEPFDESMWLDYIHVLSIDDARLVSDLLRASDSLDYMRLGISEYDDKYLHSVIARKMILLAFEANILFLKFPKLFDEIFEIS